MVMNAKATKTNKGTVKVGLEYSSIFNDPKHLEVITITGTRIRKPDFANKFNKFIESLR